MSFNKARHTWRLLAWAEAAMAPRGGYVCKPMGSHTCLLPTPVAPEARPGDGRAD